MSQVVVRPVTTWRQRRQFLNFPWVLYREDPCWMPPLRIMQKELVGFARHPFYRRNRAQAFLAYRGKEVCGRIVAILNVGHNERYQERRGFFGFFECEDDQQAAAALFDAVREWFAGQDIHCLRGPTNPSLNYEVGLLIDGFDTPPAFLTTYNPPYYQGLVEGYGFRKAQDLYTYWGRREMLPEIRNRYLELAQQIIEHHKVHLRPLDRRHFRRDVHAFLEIYNRSLVDTWGFVPMSQGELREMARSLRFLIVPELTMGAEIDGQPIGAAFGLLDYNPRIKRIRGRLFPFGFIRLLRNKREIKKTRIVSTNVIPEFQRLGVGLALLHAMAEPGLEFGLEEVEFSWILESNTLSWRSLHRGGAHRVKTHRLYDLDTPG